MKNALCSAITRLFYIKYMKVNQAIGEEGVFLFHLT